jgi:hypothetical protein
MTICCLLLSITSTVNHQAFCVYFYSFWSTRNNFNLALQNQPNDAISRSKSKNFVAGALPPDPSSFGAFGTSISRAFGTRLDPPNANPGSAPEVGTAKCECCNQKSCHLCNQGRISVCVCAHVCVCFWALSNKRLIEQSALISKKRVSTGNIDWNLENWRN